MEHNSIMWQYIAEETEVLNRLVARDDIAELAAKFRDVRDIYFVSHGSSYNASVTVMPFYARYARINVHTITAGNFMDNEDYVSVIDPEKALMVFISQTGNSRGTLVACELARKHGLKTLGVAGRKDVKLKDYADEIIDLDCGEEDSNAKTKGYSSTIMLLLLLAVELGRVNGTICDCKASEIKEEFKTQIEELKEVKDMAFSWAEKLDFGKDLKNLYIFGSSMNYGSALECEIKITETCLIPTVCCDTVEFSHGIHRSINKDCTILIIRSEYNRDFALQSFNFLKERARVMMINLCEEIDDEKVINLEYHPSLQSVLSVVEVIQVISAYAPENIGLDPNRDANNDFADAVETRI